MRSEPVPSNLRALDTARPKASAPASSPWQKVTPLRPPALPALASFAVVDRHAREAYPCMSTSCTRDAEVTAFGPFAGVEVVVMLCRACALTLPSTVKPVPIAKPGGR